MKIKKITEIPESVRKATANIWGNNSPKNIDIICFTYGDTCYGNMTSMEKHLEHHELTHTKQQGSDPDAWWELYAKDSEFRYSQELEAYRKQYKYLKKQNGKIQAFNFAKKLALDMSSEMYGNMCTYYRALQDITYN